MLHFFATCDALSSLKVWNDQLQLSHSKCQQTNHVNAALLDLLYLHQWHYGQCLLLITDCMWPLTLKNGGQSRIFAHKYVS